MSAAAGTVALAGVLPPPAAGVASPPGAPSDVAASPFDGLLAGSEASTAPGSDPLAQRDTAAPDAADAAPGGVDAVLPPSIVSTTPPPPMDDPATRSVLNALALRVATESQDAAAARVPATGSPSGGGTSTAAVALPATGARVDSAVAARVAAAAAPPDGARVPAATALGAALPGLRGAPTGPDGGSTPATTLDAAAFDGDRAGSLDALLSSREALLPTSHPKPAAAAAPVTAPAAVATAALGAATLDGSAPDAAQDLVSGLTDTPGSARKDAAAGSPDGPSGAMPASAPALPFTTHVASATGTAQAAARGDGAQPPISVPFDSPQWGNELATRVVSLAKEQFSEAQIRVTPDELGPIEVRLRFDGDRVHAQFGAISPEAREALTANLHRLREMLAGEGLNLGQAFVGHHGQDAPRRFEGQAARSGGGGGEDDDVSTLEVRGPATLRLGLLDEFA